MVAVTVTVVVYVCVCLYIYGPTFSYIFKQFLLLLILLDEVRACLAYRLFT